MISTSTLTMWVIADHPDCFVARRWEIRSGAATVTGDAIYAFEIGRLREQMRRRGLTRIPRSPSDDPVIVETWL